MYHTTRIKVNLISLDNTRIASFAWVLGYDLSPQVWLPFYLFYIRRRPVLFCFCHAILQEFPHLPGMGSRLGQANRFCPTPPKSLCPCPIRPLSTKKGHINTGNHFPCNPKIWIFHDFQAKSQLYAIKQKVQLFLN